MRCGSVQSHTGLLWDAVCAPSVWLHDTGRNTEPQPYCRCQSGSLFALNYALWAYSIHTYSRPPPHFLITTVAIDTANWLIAPKKREKYMVASKLVLILYLEPKDASVCPSLTVTYLVESGSLSQQRFGFNTIIAIGYCTILEFDPGSSLVVLCSVEYTLILTSWLAYMIQYIPYRSARVSPECFDRGYSWDGRLCIIAGPNRKKKTVG